MKQFSYFLLLTLLFLGKGMAQPLSLPAEEGREDRFLCGTPAFEEQLRQQYPEMGSREAYEVWLAEAMRQQELKDAGSRSILTIPVVFHIIHNGQAVGVGNNIAQSLVQSQMDVLNEDFRRLANTPGGNTQFIGKC